MNTAGRYRKRPVEIEALQWDPADPDKCGDLASWLLSHSAIWEHDPPDGLVISTLEGDMHASPGDWIIRGLAGEFYPCKPDIFQATYEAVDG